MDEKRNPGSDSSGSGTTSDPFRPIYKTLLSVYPETSFKVEVTLGGIWICDITTREGMATVDWNPKREKMKFGVSDIPGDGGFTHQPDFVLETAEEAGGSIIGLMWRKEFDRKEASRREVR